MVLAGTGLSTVLGLVQYYKVPLEHIIVSDIVLFDELADDGNLSERMFLALKMAQPYNWNYYPVTLVQVVRERKEMFLEVDY